MRKPEATCTENSRPYIGRSIGKTNIKELLIEVTSPEQVGLRKNIQKITSPPNINKNDVMMSNPSNNIKVNQDTTNNPLEMPDNPNKQGNEKIRNKEGNNQEYEPINHPIANCEIKIKRTVDLPENNTEQTNEKTTFKVNDNELEQTNCQPKTEVDHANISAKPIITHNHMYNEYPKHNRERHKDINLTEKTNREQSV
jgi:hypothetical protein